MSIELKFKLNTSAMNLAVQSHEVFLYINVHKLYTNAVVVAIFAHGLIHTYQISFNSSSTWCFQFMYVSRICISFLCSL